jgi:hypothetical protein
MEEAHVHVHIPHVQFEEELKDWERRAKGEVCVSLVLINSNISI